MKIVYDDTARDKELFCENVLSPFVAQFHGLSHATITTCTDVGHPETKFSDFHIVDSYGDIIYTYTECGDLTCEDLALITARFLTERNKEDADF